MYCCWISSIVNVVMKKSLVSNSSILILWHLKCDIQHIT